jgi:hypothetical protein
LASLYIPFGWDTISRIKLDSRAYASFEASLKPPAGTGASGKRAVDKVEADIGLEREREKKYFHSSYYNTFAGEISRIIGEEKLKDKEELVSARSPHSPDVTLFTSSFQAFLKQAFSETQTKHYSQSPTIAATALSMSLASSYGAQSLSASPSLPAVGGEKGGKGSETSSVRGKSKKHPKDYFTNLLTKN